MCDISSKAVLNHADANGNTTLSSGVFESGLSTKTVDFESISAVNKYKIYVKI